MNWVKLTTMVADPGVIYRVMWCSKCQSLRYHKIVRLKIAKTNNEWWVFLQRTCNGLPPVMEGKRPRLIRNCRYSSREWLIASQWNWLVKVNVYAA